MKDLKVNFEDIKNLSLVALKVMILGERDRISKNFIAKINRKNNYHSLRKAYDIYYKSSLWKECIRPLLIAYGINSGSYEKLLNGAYKCSCGNVTNYYKLVPHHVKYPPLAKKYKYKGFDGRIKLNHPDRIIFMCDVCHEEFHRNN